MFRFTIRDVLWLTVVVALAVAWWVDHRSHASQTSVWVEVPDGGRVLLQPLNYPDPVKKITGPLNRP